MGLTGKQKLFADRYILVQNATSVYKEVYKVKSDNTAAVNGLKLLRNTKVKQYINERQEKLSSKLQITQEMVLEGYRKLAFYDARNFYGKEGNILHIPDLDDETAFALTGFEVTEESDYVDGSKFLVGYTRKIKMSDRKAALDGICKVLGYNAAEKREHSFDKNFFDFLKETSGT